MPIFRTTSYRYPFERIILGGTVLLVILIIMISATVTLSLAGLVILLFVGFSYFANRAQHNSLVQRSYPINSRSAPELVTLTNTCQARIQPGAVQIFVAPSPQMNAYTFGITDPKVIVMYSALFKQMDLEELRFILGHEMGHVSLGHTWLNSLLGGMAGIPTSIGASVLLNASFLWWNRTCEYSADRAGLLACGNPTKAISALVKLATGSRIQNQGDLAQALRSIESQDAGMLNRVQEILSTHPVIMRRIQALRRFAASSHYTRLQARVNQNPIG
jgi:Zn-dependent protease with chaperone function